MVIRVPVLMVAIVTAFVGAACCAFGSDEGSKAGSCRMMGFNIWGPFFGNPVEERTGKIAGVIVRYGPDVLAIQDALDVSDHCPVVVDFEIVNAPVAH